MWPFSSRQSREHTAPIFFTNTLSGKKELFTPRRTGKVTMYSCGPTVYGPVQIGNLRSFVMSDVVARIIIHARYTLRRVMNITDVGHLVGDAEEGEDKMAVGAKREETTPQAIAKRYADLFLDDLRALNLDVAHMLFPRATEYIEEDIKLIQELEKKGFTYRTPAGLYFDTSKFPNYGRLRGLMNIKLIGGARVAMNDGRKNIHDFALWRIMKKGDLQYWDSPWGRGNPGWSIECSAMAMSLLGTEIDIHTGGEDLASVHHNNEIAQSEAATERPFVRYWLHGAFLNVEGEKMSKSLGNVYTLADIRERNIHPLSLRYLFLQAHYRGPLTFSFISLQAADEALKRLWRRATEVAQESKQKNAPSDADRKLVALIRDDIGTPAALAHLWETLASEEVSPQEKWGALESAEAVFGLSLLTPPSTTATLGLADLPKDVQALAHEREEARKARDFAKADELRIHIETRGYAVEDTASGPLFTKREK